MRTTEHPRTARTLRLVVAAVALASLQPACTDGFTDLNTNPNAPTEVAPELLLRQVVFDLADGLSYEGFTGGANLGQYFSAEPGFNAFDRGDLLAPQFGGNPWPLLYRNLRDITLVLDASRDDPALAVYEGPALVLRSYIAGAATDLFGDVPYAEAARGRNGEVTPAYDRQEEVYLGAGGILASLRAAVADMDAYAGVQPLEGDPLYAGDLDGWIRMANSLRLRYALRAYAAGGVEVVAEVLDVIHDGRLVLEGSQDAVFAFGAAPNDFRFARARLGDFTNYLMSATVDRELDALDDPRERLWFRPAGDSVYAGVRNGLPAGFAVDGDSVSLPGEIWRERAAALKYPFVTSWETNFVLAELAARPVIFDNARARYEAGVREAFAYWGVALPDGYLALGSPAAYDADRAVEQVVTQRWLASIGAGYEGWTLWRRTGVPAFLPPVASLIGGTWPVRFPYPADEQALNRANYEAAVEELGGANAPTVPVWWDVD